LHKHRLPARKIRLPATVSDAVGRNRRCATKPRKTSQCVPDQTSAPAGCPTTVQERGSEDITGDGVPDLWIYYNPQKRGKLCVRKKLQGDGRVDTWSYFKDGKLCARGRYQGHGKPDTSSITSTTKSPVRSATKMARPGHLPGGLRKRPPCARRERQPRVTADQSLGVLRYAKDGEVISKEERDLKR